MTQRQAESYPHGTHVQWTRKGEECMGRLFHDITTSFIDWNDGQRTYVSDDAAMKFVQIATSGKTISV